MTNVSAYIVKPGVSFDGIQPETIMGILVTSDIMKKRGHMDVITAITDGKHMDGSLHYEGLAFDRRTWANEQGEQLPDAEKDALARLFREALGPNWDVVVESTHIHCEFDKRKTS